MILVRNVFQIQFGKAKEATALWKEGITLGKRLGFGDAPARLLTDLAGPSFYTLVLEFEYKSLSDYEGASTKVMDNPEWKTWYAKISPLLVGGHREILNIVS